MSDSSPPGSRSFVARVMGVKELILAITSLIVAVTSIVVPASHKVTQSAYEELSKDVREVSSATMRNHDDIVALRGYLDGLRGTTLVVPNTPIASASMAAMLVSKPPMPPFVGPKPTAQNPPSFDHIKSKK